MDDDAPRARYIFKPQAELTWAILTAAMVAAGVALTDTVWTVAGLAAITRPAIAAGKNALVNALEQHSDDTQ